MNPREKDEAIKDEFDMASMANNIQVLGHVRHHTLFTNLKLGLDLPRRQPIAAQSGASTTGGAGNNR